MKRLVSLALGLLFFPQLSHGEDLSTMNVVTSVDLTKYAGKWYEIARLPNRFQKDCTGEVTATYSPLGDGRLKVVNECRTAEGVDRAEGEARPASGEGPQGKLEVRFAPAWLSWLDWVWGDYWILNLAPDYSHSLVGSPDRKYLWVLARSPHMERDTYEKILAHASAEGFDVDPLILTGKIID